MRRRRTNARVPAKGRLRDIADTLWSVVVKQDWALECAICRARGDLNSHHLIPRQHYATRYDLQNGICLCRRCHQFCAHRSPHQNAAGFILWLKSLQPDVYAWYMVTMESGAYRNFTSTRNADYYCEVIRCLKQYLEDSEYEAIVGHRFAAWLEDG